MHEEIANRARRYSRRELLRFNGYVENSGISTTIIGGWAVCAYNPYLESIDIDAVVPKDRVSNAELILTEQCGWLPTTTDMPIWKRFFKPIPDSGPNDYILFDLLSTNLINAFHEDNRRRIPFHICLEQGFYSRKSINNLITINVPKKDLLLLYKLKAYRDRIFDMHNKKITETGRRRLTAKATKDLSDTIALMDPEYEPLDVKSLKILVGRYDLQFLSTTIEELPLHTEAIEQYRGTPMTVVKSWVQRVLEAFK